MNYQTVLDFWFSGSSEPFWFAKSLDFDKQIHAHFFTIWQQAQAGELAHWRENAHGRLAEILVLDQFSRNLHRGSPLAFAQDGMALVLAQYAVLSPEFAQLSPNERQFTLLPFMHSESLAIHNQAIELFSKYTSETVQDFEQQHLQIIQRFGRYPHRNAVLGRESTAEEILFLEQEHAGF